MPSRNKWGSGHAAASQRRGIVDCSTKACFFGRSSTYRVRTAEYAEVVPSRALKRGDGWRTAAQAACIERRKTGKVRLRCGLIAETCNQPRLCIAHILYMVLSVLHHS